MVSKIALLGYHSPFVVVPPIRMPRDSREAKPGSKARTWGPGTEPDSARWPAFDPFFCASYSRVWFPGSAASPQATMWANDNRADGLSHSWRATKDLTRG